MTYYFNSMGKKIFDCIFSHGNFDLMKKRIHENNQIVTHTFIITQDNHFEKIDQYFSENSSVSIFLENESYENSKFYSNLIRKKIKSHFKSFEDWVIISYDNEIPDIKKFLEQSEELTCTNLYHRVCSLDESKCKKFLSEGSLVINMSEITTNKNFLSLRNPKIKKMPCLEDKLECGVTILSQSEFLDEKYFCELSEKNIPFNVRFENKSKNFLISFVEPNENKIGEYDKIFIIELTNEFPEILFNSSDENIERVKLFFPKNQIYKDNDFMVNYLKRESLRILNLTNKIDDDIVWIQFENKIESYTVKELKNPS